MSFILNGSTIRRPNKLNETNLTQFAEQQTLSGAIGRDYFGNNKRIWTLQYDNLNATDYAALKALYNTYLTNGTGLSWQVTEANYTVAATTVHVDLQNRDFTVPGSSYLSGVSLVLKEA